MMDKKRKLNRKKCVGAMVLFMIGLGGHFKKRRQKSPTGGFMSEVVELDNRQYKRYKRAKKSHLWQLKSKSHAN